MNTNDLNSFNDNGFLIKDNLIKVLKLMIPFTPHLAHECLEILGCKTTEKWPEIKGNLIEEVQFAIQVNGKTRDVMLINKDLDEKGVKLLIMEKSKVLVRF